MTSKEAYYILIEAWHGNKDNGNYPSFDDINEALDTLKQALERLEMLENENQILNMSVKDTYDTSQEIISELKQENEKLKNEKEQIKQWVIKKIKYLDKGVFLMSGERVKGAIEILNELLKEVLNNENHSE